MPFLITVNPTINLNLSRLNLATLNEKRSLWHAERRSSTISIVIGKAVEIAIYRFGAYLE